MDGTTSAMRGGVNEFLLDSRTPGGSASNIKNNDEYYPRPPSDIGSTSSLNLDYAEEERSREADIERKVNALLEETRIWRLANSAQWVAWGIVQAKVPELDGKDPGTPDTITEDKELDLPPEDKRPEGLRAEALMNGESEEEMERETEGDEDEFDYLAYAQHRARFFWGDVVAMGLMKEEELPEACFGEGGPVKVEY